MHSVRIPIAVPWMLGTWKEMLMYTVHITALTSSQQPTDKLSGVDNSVYSTLINNKIYATRVHCQTAMLVNQLCDYPVENADITNHSERSYYIIYIHD